MRVMLDGLPWERVEQTKEFLDRLWHCECPDRPAAIVHDYLDVPVPDPPGTLTDEERGIWAELQALRRRAIGRDDYVPTVSTNMGTCAMATAFGAREMLREGIHWVHPLITDLGQIDHLKKPDLRAGLLAGAMRKTRMLRQMADPRVGIRLMDLQNPFTIALQLLGTESFFSMPYDAPGKLHALMDLITDFFIDFVREQIRLAGPACVPGVWPPVWFPQWMGVQIADDNLHNVSPQVYREFCLPYNNRISDAFGGLFLHSCTIPEPHLDVIAEHHNLRGINCDLSTSAPLATLLDRFGRQCMVAPHVYINTNTRYPDIPASVADMLSAWQPGYHLFIYVCTVMWVGDESREVRMAPQEIYPVLDRVPAWRQAHAVP